MPNDIQIIIDAGYEIRQCSSYHFKVYFNDTHINVWPSTQKYMPEKSCPATEYEDVSEVIEYMKKKEAHVRDHGSALEAITNRIHSRGKKNL